MKPLASILAGALMVLTASATYAAQPAAWEPLKTDVREAKPVAKEQDTEILAASAAIIVKTEKPTNVKVFTILGRLVSSETLPPGRSRLNLGVHGVYIVKIGDLTCKVAI